MSELNNIYTVTQTDIAYPKRLLNVLGEKAPPLIYYCGNSKLANMDNVAIVGSRIIDEQAEKYTMALAKKAVGEGYAICSGGAKGTDRTAEKTALEAGGFCISFLADSITKKLSQTEIQQAVLSGKMLLLSAVSPNAPFHTGNAMARNRYIYAMSQCAFVIASDYNKGGTWAGASQNIKSHLSNTYVWDNSKYSGNKQLIAKGGIGIDNLDLFSVADLAIAEVKSYPEQIGFLLS